MTDVTTSPERQRDIISKAADVRGAKIVGWAEDLDVSASKVHPTMRPELGGWLKRPDEFDELIFWRVDRFVRKLFPDFSDMIAWATKHDKNLVSATEFYDLQTPMGKGMASMLVTFAEMEAAATAERVKGAHAALRRQGRWGNGRPAYGYRSVQTPTGFILAVDDEAAKVLRDVVRRVIAGEAPNAIVIDLNQRGIPTPQDRWRELSSTKDKPKPVRGAGWSRTGLVEILRSDAMLGHVRHNGRAVVGEDGMPLIRVEPLVSQTQWDELQAVLEQRSVTKTRTHGVSLLLDVAFCECGEKLYRWAKTNPRGTTYAYYICASKRYRDGRKVCRVKSIPAGELEEFVTSTWLQLAGWWPMRERVFVPGESHDDEIAQVRRALNTVRREYDDGSYEYPGGEDEYLDRTRQLSGRLAALLELPNRAAAWEYRPTGRTYLQEWNAAAPAARHVLLKESGLRVELAAEPWTEEAVDRLVHEYQPPAIAHLGRVAVIVTEGQFELSGVEAA